MGSDMMLYSTHTFLSQGSGCVVGQLEGHCCAAAKGFAKAALRLSSTTEHIVPLLQTMRELSDQLMRTPVPCLTNVLLLPERHVLRLFSHRMLVVLVLVADHARGVT
jgi:hypothetical protein